VGSPGESEDKRSWLQQIDSRVQLVAVCALALSLWIAGPHGLLVGALLLGLLVVSTGTRLPSRLSLLVPVTLILCFSLLANAVVVDGTYDLSFWGNAGISWRVWLVVHERLCV
jgi:energy-coupling factor transport system permease protein